MSSSNNLWPNNDNKDLIIGVANYLQDLLNQNKSKLDEVAIDSLTVATESLQTIISPDDEQLPKSSFSLEQIYKSYKSSSTSSSKPNNDDEKKQKQIPSNIQKRREKFLEFIQVLKKHDFFKGCSEGSNDYQIRMEKARTQYNTRFPNSSIDSLDWLKDNNNNNDNNNNDNNNQNKKKNITDDDKKEGERLKSEGNKLLGRKQYSQAIEKYSQAIKCNPQSAVYYSNRAAAYTYLKNYQQAVTDSRKASEIDPNYVKAYVREGLAEFEMGNYQNSMDAYQKALDRTKSTEKAWETYMEKVQLCQMKLDEESGMNNNDNDGNANPFAGMGGGAAGGPDLSNLGNLLGGLGGGAGGGGLDFNKLMQNPMMQQMAQQMMQDPNAMKKMADMMGGLGGMGGMPGGGAGGGGGDNDGGGANDMDVNAVMADLLQNPEKAKGIFEQAMNDPEVKQLMEEDPAIEPLINRIKTGDYAAFMELGGKPQAMAKVKSLIQKYYKK